MYLRGLPLILPILCLAVSAVCAGVNVPVDPRPRVIVSSEIGGADFDNFQSLVRRFAAGI